MQAVTGLLQTDTGFYRYKCSSISCLALLEQENITPFIPDSESSNPRLFTGKTQFDVHLPRILPQINVSPK